MTTRRSVLASAALASLAVPAKVGAQDTLEALPTEELNIPFGEVGGVPLKLDVFRPAPRETPRPAVVVAHPWLSARGTMYKQARELAAAGYVAVTIDYRSHWPTDHLDDGQLAVRWLRANAATYGIDPERIGAYGHSGGANLAALLGVRETRDPATAAFPEHPSRVACVVEIAGDLDLSLPYPPTAQEAVTEDLGGTIEEVPEAYREVSPVTFVDERSAPMMLIQGGNDQFVPVEQSVRMSAALQAAGVDTVALYFAEGTHGTIANWAMNGAYALAFFGRYLHPER